MLLKLFGVAAMGAAGLVVLFIMLGGIELSMLSVALGVGLVLSGALLLAVQDIVDLLSDVRDELIKSNRERK